MAVVETVKIISQDKQGYIIINKSDFTNRDTIFKEKEKIVEVAEKEEIVEEAAVSNSKRRKEGK